MPNRILDPSLLRPLDPRRDAAEAAPGVDALHPAPGCTVYETLGIRIDRDGTWYYHGSPILRKELVCLFASALKRDADGRYWLVTPREMGPVEVEDVPFIAVEMYVGGSGAGRVISFRTNVDEIVTLTGEDDLFVVHDPATSEPSPYVRLPRRREARLSRAVYYELVGIAEEADIGGCRNVGVWSGGTFFRLGPAGDPAGEAG